MRQKQLRLVVTFHTTAEAMALEQLCRHHAIPGKLFSAPRSLSADCGIAWQSPPEEKAHIAQLLHTAGLEIHGIHELEV